MSKPTYFTFWMKMADLIQVNYRLIPYFKRFDVKMGFGDDTVKQVCTRHNVNTDTFLLICNAHTFKDFLTQDISHIEWPVEEVIHYMSDAHRYYLSIRFPVLKCSIADAGKFLNPDFYKKFYRIFANCCSNIESNIYYEEQVIIPNLKQKHPQAISSNDIMHLHHRHQIFLPQLEELKALFIGYVSYTELYHDALYHLLLLKDEITTHTILEEKALMSIIQQSEKQSGPTGLLD